MDASLCSPILHQKHTCTLLVGECIVALDDLSLVLPGHVTFSPRFVPEFHFSRPFVFRPLPRTLVSPPFEIHSINPSCFPFLFGGACRFRPETSSSSFIRSFFPRIRPPNPHLEIRTKTICFGLFRPPWCDPGVHVVLQDHRRRVLRHTIVLQAHKRSR